MKIVTCLDLAKTSGIKNVSALDAFHREFIEAYSTLTVKCPDDESSGCF